MIRPLTVWTWFPGGPAVVHQFYQTRVIDEFVLRGNAATLKCLVPSFVSDFVQVVEWVADDGSSFASSRADDGYGNARVKPAACQQRPAD